MSEVQRPARIFYGWVIVGLTFITQFVTMGLAYYSLGVYIKPLSESLAVDRVDIAWAVSIQAIVAAVISPLAGRWYAQYSTRTLLMIGTALLAGGFVLLSQITNVWQLYLLFGGVVGIALVLLGVIPSNMLLANWFVARRGTAMGISQFGITISATVLVPVVTWIVLNYDWQTAFAACGIGAFIILTPLILRFAVRMPQDIGLHADGALHSPPVPDTSQHEQWTLRRALRNRDIWAMTMAVGPCYFGIAAIVLSLPAHVTDLGISALDAASVVAVTTFMGALAKPLFGTLSDFVSPRLALAVSILLQFIGVGMLLPADNLLLLSAAGACFGLGYGAVAPLWSMLLSKRFGTHTFAQVMGANMAMLMPFNIGGLPLTNYIFKITGSYLPAFAILLAGYVIAAIALSRFRTTAAEAV